MNKDNILDLLKSKNRNFRLPKHLDFSIEGKVLTISLSMEGLTSNMQTDDAAFDITITYTDGDSESEAVKDEFINSCTIDKE